MKKYKNCPIKLLTTTLILFYAIVCPKTFAQFGPSPVFNNAEPAFWIAPPNLAGDQFAVFHLRKSFILNEVPTSFIVHISADNRYRFAVNGKHISSGPQRSDLMHWRYETVDLAPYLTSGNNLLTATVWNWGELKPAAQFSHRTAFLLQGNSPFEADIVNSNKSWKAWHNMSFSGIPVSWTEVGGYYAAQPGERIDGNLYPWGWDKKEYNDDQWPHAVTGIGYRAERTRLKGSAPTGEGNHWQLVPRTLPQMEESETRFARVRRTDGVKMDDGFLSARNDLVIPAHSKASILVDNNILTNAYIVINTSGGQGSEIKLTYAEALKDKDGIKGHRDQIEGKTISGVRDEFYPDGGDQRRFQTLWFRTYRYVQLDIETNDQTLAIHDFHGIYTAYPFELQASFSSDQTWLKDMWDINWRVARLCAGETYYDTPYYEQLQYIGDTRIQALLTMYMTKDDRLVKQAISHFDSSRIHSGITASRYPSELGQYIPTFSLIWVAMVHDYWMHRDETAYVKTMLPGIRSVLSWFENQIDNTGLVGPLTWWPFIDWADGWTLGRPPGAKDGHSVMISMQFAYALQRAAELETSLGEAYQANYYLGLSEKIIAAAKNQAWDADKGLFRDALESNDMSQQTNIMASLISAIESEQQSDFVRKVIADKTITQSTYYYSFYVLEALKQAGLANEYLDQLGPWKNMLALGLTTTPETPEPTRSDSHAWSAHPNYGLLATVLGIRPASPGFKSVVIQPALGKLTHAKGSMPHPNGQITVDITEITNTNIKAKITLPKGLSGNFIWQGQKVNLRPGEQAIDL